MKQILVLFAVLLSTGPVTLSDLMGTDTSQTFWAVFGPLTETITATATTVGPVVLSTGPVILKSFLSADCYKVDKVNPNGTIATYPLTWTGCPK